MKLQHAAFEIELQQREPRQAARQIFGVPFVQLPHRSRRAEGNRHVFGKDGQLRQSPAIGRIEQFQADLEDTGDGAMAPPGSGILQGPHSLAVDDGE